VIRPFPWRSLESVTRTEVAALRDARRWGEGHGDLARVPAVFGELLDAPVRMFVRRACPAAASRALQGGSGVLLARAEAPELGRAVLVEAEGALVVSMVARVLRRSPPSVLGSEGPGESAVGAFAAIVAAAARRAHAGSAMRVLAAGPAAALERDLGRLGQELWSVGLTVLLGDEAFEARVVLARGALRGTPPVPWDASVLTALGPLPLRLPVVAHEARATATELATLRPGDAWMLVGSELTRSASGAELVGPVVLAPSFSCLGVAARLVDGGRLVLGGDAVALSAAEPQGEAEAKMSEPGDAAGLIEAVGEVPVVVRVEIGEAEMTAREWAAVGRGDVLALGRRVGEGVLLRIGGVPVARGELVEIDGEVGVRIVERIGREGA
jgi:flagellar motor switch/type III secretory pathway protein FliN